MDYKLNPKQTFTENPPAGTVVWTVGKHGDIRKTVCLGEQDDLCSVMLYPADSTEGITGCCLCTSLFATREEAEDFAAELVKDDKSPT